jgi:hypothetical protein
MCSTALSGYILGTLFVIAFKHLQGWEKFGPNLMNIVSDVLVPMSLAPQVLVELGAESKCARSSSQKALLCGSRVRVASFTKHVMCASKTKGWPATLVSTKLQWVACCWPACWLCA